MQDELITIRGERFVIPVKVEQKRRVQGVVHGASSSGQTVFVEPLETIEQNNELVRLLDEEQAEIHRILLEMTRRIGEHSECNSRREESLARTRTAIRQSPLRRRLQLRRSKLVWRRALLPVSDVETRLPLTAPAQRAQRACSSTTPATLCWNAILKLKSAQPIVPVTVELEGRPPPAGHHRPQHRRQNRHPENRRPARPDGAIRNPRPRRPRRTSRLRRRARRHRRLSIHRAKSFHLLRPRHQHRFHFPHRHRTIRWSCSTNSAPPPIPKKAPHSPSPSPDTSAASAA